MKQLRLSLFLVLTVMCISTPTSRGQVLVGNYPSTDGVGSSITASQWKAVSFTMPAQAYNIDNVVLRLGNYVAANSPNPAVGFYTDNAGIPGSLVGSLLNDAPLSGSTANADFTFTPSGTLTLSAGDTYWLVVAGESGTFNFRSTTTPVSGAATPGSFMVYNANTTTWSPSGTANAFQVNATPVPEPAHVALVGSGALLAFACIHRWRSKQFAKQG